MYQMEREKERMILVGVSLEGQAEAYASLRELEELAETAGAEVVSKILQNREGIHPATYVGKGKLEELRGILYHLDADGIICDDELTPAQMKNLEEELSCKIVDRTLLILDIFAARARTSEGKLQVEMAQLKYRQARLVGLRSSLSRLGGGIGTRGPGEKKLEMDRRLISSRIAALRRELEEVQQHRDVLRESRKRGNFRTAAIVGYTNAGKSTLLNVLTGSEVLEEDALFATLDPTTRLLELPRGGEILLTDTVGFIRKLPHHLIEAFKSTLEEAVLADVIVHVVDASNEQMEQQMYVVYETLRELGAEGKPVVTLFNKQDKLQEERVCKDLKADYSLRISAKTGQGLEKFRETLEEILLAAQIYIERVYSYTEAGKIALIRQKGQLISEEYLPEGIQVKAYVPREIYGNV
ncbi:MAG TPA: GTPase HflX [Candidatus Scatomonas pullistercoris]|uniref:GTPase HflX n=1 Tax=Candidatus Scatomonas pullistercoris TaxID=2840920 RepID=A0A9D1P2E2_9FIRM|nr:GTPase HflX [Candidatus Scatomonas pullistercoris]